MRHGALINSTHAVLSHSSPALFMINSAGLISWQISHPLLSNGGIHVVFQENTLYWMVGSTTLMIVGGHSPENIHIFKFSITATFAAPNFI